MAIEYIVPNADNSDGSWTNSSGNAVNLYDYVDNGISGGTPNDSTYLSSSNLNDTCVLDLETIAGTTNAGTDIILRFRRFNNFTTSQTALYEGATEIWSSIQESEFDSQFEETVQTIPGASGDNIVDYSDLNIRVTNVDGGGNLQISEIELEFDTDGGGGGGSAVADFIRFENGCMSDFRGMVNIRG